MITPMDIHNKTFSKGLRGYSEEEVNDFLRQIVTDYEQIYREHREMEEEMDQMKLKLSNYERISDTMTATLQLAKDTAENVKKNAKRNADILISNAKMEGDRQVKDAEDYRRRLAETMIHTEGNMKNYVSKIRKDLELALASIDALENLKAPIVPGYAYPAVELPKEEAPAEEIPTEEAPDEAAPAEETPVEAPAEETKAPAEEPAPDAEGTPIEEPAPAAEEADMAEEKPEEEKEEVDYKSLREQIQAIDDAINEGPSDAACDDSDELLEEFTGKKMKIAAIKDEDLAEYLERLTAIKNKYFEEE